MKRGGLTKERINKLLKVCANVIHTTKGIDDMELKYFVQASAIAVRRVRKQDMRYVAKTTCATLEKGLHDIEDRGLWYSTIIGFEVEAAVKV
ncbi:T-complex protein 1 subunit alpha [Dionaea muscipula]